MNNNNTNNNLIWLTTFADNMKDDFKFAVKEEWLRELMKGYAQEDFENSSVIERDRESYVEGRTDGLMDYVCEEADRYYINDIYDIASEKNAVIGSE